MEVRRDSSTGIGPLLRHAQARATCRSSRARTLWMQPRRAGQRAPRRRRARRSSSRATSGRGPCDVIQGRVTQGPPRRGSDMAKESSFDVVSQGGPQRGAQRRQHGAEGDRDALRLQEERELDHARGRRPRAGLRQRGQAQAGRRGARGEARAPQGAAQGPAVRQGRRGARRHGAPARARSPRASRTRRPRP